jgi:surface protein
MFKGARGHIVFCKNLGKNENSFRAVDLSFWDVSKVTNMESMFADSYISSDIFSKWDVSKVTNMSCMFSHCWGTHTNIYLSNWDVSNVKTMQKMFSKSNFTGNISNWNVSNVTDMSSMFEQCASQAEFGDITKFNVGNVTTMSGMFHCTDLNPDIGAWNVSKVKNMCNMFARARKFNQDISKWDVSNVQFTAEMFNSACEFDQDLSAWNITSVEPMWKKNMFGSCPISCAHLPEGHNETVCCRKMANLNRKFKRSCPAVPDNCCPVEFLFFILSLGDTN